MNEASPARKEHGLCDFLRMGEPLAGIGGLHLGGVAAGSGVASKYFWTIGVSVCRRARRSCNDPSPAPVDGDRPGHAEDAGLRRGVDRQERVPVGARIDAVLMMLPPVSRTPAQLAAAEKTPREVDAGDPVEVLDGRLVQRLFDLDAGVVVDHVKAPNSRRSARSQQRAPRRSRRPRTRRPVRRPRACAATASAPSALTS